MVLKVFDPEIARKTILKRMPMDEMPVPAGLQSSIEKIFGEALTPDQAVTKIISDVRTEGDQGLRKWAEKLDGGAPEGFKASEESIRAALRGLPNKQLKAMELAAERIRKFHEKQPVTSWMTQDLGGTIGQLVRPIRRVGIYIPAGTAPLPSSVLMSAVIAQVAGVKEIALVAPPERKTGRISSLILATAAMLGITEVYVLGGAQAIAALAYGTESIPAVDKIYGPGNLFVTLAKKQVFGVVGIDSIAGPTETLVIADESANPEWVAADLLAQAEHDVLASAILLTPSKKIITEVGAAIKEQLKERSRADVIKVSLENRSGAVLTKDLQEAVDLANLYAPEHLCLSVQDPWNLSQGIYAAGGIFVGEHSCEVLGDYVAGPSHVMPTSGSARYISPLNVLDFVHMVSLVALDAETTRQIAPAAIQIAESEGLDAHANAARIRL
ncbi:MAG: histidinol dehydrogenase [Anaerolineaceae bacterium]|nr:histidinol dehydrogenase [Anaerolineaceae bacterium]